MKSQIVKIINDFNDFVKLQGELRGGETMKDE